MPPPIAEQVVEFFADLFERVFSARFRPLIRDPLKRRAVVRQIEEAADAASQSLIRLFRNQQLSDTSTASLLGGFAGLGDQLNPNGISNANVSPESVAEEVLDRLPMPTGVDESLYRVSLHSIIQVLMLVAPVMAEWRKLSFAGTYELLHRVVQRLTQINEQVDALGRAGREAVDERYEWTYRDYLLQRFHRVEAGTVRMTTNLDVDLGELFVMPRFRHRAPIAEIPGQQASDLGELMDLKAARRFFGGVRHEIPQRKSKEGSEISALEGVRRSQRLVIVGPPGSGKSTFFEWLQLKLAGAEEALVAGDQQAIPLLLRVRQLDPRDLPDGSALIEKATGSKDRATLMPDGWIERQMRQGRLLLLLDGLDETEPELRDGFILPWLRRLCTRYPDCRYLVSSRPVGYPSGFLQKLGFMECDLLDFSDSDIEEYTRHWCTAVRLARNEPAEEARREGAAEGEQIVRAFKGNPYIRNLAQNPLMLSAICLVQYFEGGRLPEDRALLYRLCVEGLLHHWDQRRGIRSEYGLEEKLRACRELALAMQAEDRAEFPGARVEQVFAGVLGDSERARRLLEHVRYRTGLLLERRAGVFAFAHLTFQEYLAARAVQEGNDLKVDAARLAQEHSDGRWNEVIALYCGLAPAAATRALIEFLLGQPPSEALAEVLTEAYLSTGPELLRDSALRRDVLTMIATSPADYPPLERFPPPDVAPVANEWVGKVNVQQVSKFELRMTGGFRWLQLHWEHVDLASLRLADRLQGWRDLDAVPRSELAFLAHRVGSDGLLAELACDSDFYRSEGPGFSRIGDWALAALVDRGELGTPGKDAAFLVSLRVAASAGQRDNSTSHRAPRQPILPHSSETWLEFAALARELAKNTQSSPWSREWRKWARYLEGEYTKRTGKRTISQSRTRRT